VVSKSTIAIICVLLTRITEWKKFFKVHVERYFNVTANDIPHVPDMDLLDAIGLLIYMGMLPDLRTRPAQIQEEIAPVSGLL
jgi:hypothetical protein